MDFNHQLIADFFTAMHQHDFSKMQNIYANDIAFFDPMFQYFNEGQVMMMWRFRIENAASFSVDFSNITDEGDGYFTVDVVLHYVNPKNKPIHLKMKSYLRIINNKIAEHSDAYSIHGLCKQERGISGNWIGWNRMYQNRLKLEAKKAVLAYAQSTQ